LLEHSYLLFWLPTAANAWTLVSGALLAAAGTKPVRMQLPIQSIKSYQ